MKILSLCALLLVLAPTLARSESILGISEAIKLALAKNHLLKAAEFEKQASERDKAASYSRYMPRVFLDSGVTASNAPTRTFMMKLDEARFSQNDFIIDNLNHPSARADFRTALSLEQPLFDLGISRSAKMAAQEDTVRSHALEQRREDVAMQVYAAYLDVQKAQAYLKVTDQAVSDAKEHLRLATVRNGAGVGLKSDELRAQTFLAEMEQQKISAANNWHLAKLRLARAIGSETGETIAIREDAIAPMNARNLGELRALADQFRQDLKGVEAGVEKAETGIKLAAGNYWPTVYASASYQLNDRDVPLGRDNDSWQVGANLRWEIFDGLRRSNEVGKARAIKNSAAEYLVDFRKEIALQVEESWLRREEAEKKLEVAKDSVKVAEETVRLLNRRFENALATLVEILDAQTALNRARAQLIDNESSYALASANIYHAAGLFLKEVVK